MKRYFSIFSLVVILFFSMVTRAQLPQRNLVYVLLYSATGTNGTINTNVNDSLFNYDPTQPVSATNPSLNTIQMPPHCVGLAVSPVLGSSDTTLTFYTQVNGTFWYYDHNTATWVNTGHTTGQPAAVNMGAGGGYIYTFQAQGFFPSVYRYDGTGTPVSVAGGMISPTPYDLIADCSGNFYTMGGGLAGIWYIRKYSSAGTVIQGYTLNNINNWSGSGGMANIGHDIYTDKFGSPNFIHSVLSSTVANVIDTTANMPFMLAAHRVDDMASFGGSLSDVLPLISINSNDTNICNGGTTTIASHVINPGTNGAYQWYVNGILQNGATDSTFTYHAAGTGTATITLHYTAGGDCGSITAISTGLAIHVTSVTQPIINVHDTLICTPGSVHITASVSNLNSNMKFRWSPASIISPANTQSVTVSVLASTNIVVTVIDSAAATCVKRSSDTIHLTVSDASAFNAYGTTAICEGDVAKLYARGGASYIWSPSSGLVYITDSDVVVTPTVTTSYKVEISNQDGCSALIELPVTVNKAVVANAGADQYIKAGDSAILHATGGAYYHWSPAYYLYPDNKDWVKATPDKTTQYVVVVTSSEGCTAMDSVTVHVINISMPNAFSPNGDGLNDKFNLKFSSHDVQLLSFNIYNRWGTHLFYTNDIKQGWDGTYNGSLADVGTYFYLIQYSIGTKAYTEKGDVVLIR